MKKNHLFDLLLCLGLIVVGLSLLIVIKLTREEGELVRVRHNGDVIMECSLEEDGEFPLLDGKNLLVIEGGAAYMRSADCPDKLCVHQGKISLGGERITCLPNKIMIEIVGEGEEVFVS